jgi:hypothetical protein
VAADTPVGRTAVEILDKQLPADHNHTAATGFVLEAATLVDDQHMAAEAAEVAVCTREAADSA